MKGNDDKDNNLKPNDYENHKRDQREAEPYDGGKDDDPETEGFRCE